MKVTVVGMGYIGLPTAIALSLMGGHEVIGYDIDKDVIDTLESGAVHINEPGLQELYSAVYGTDRFKVSTEIERSDVFIICVPTPLKGNWWELQADLNYVLSAACKVGSVLSNGNLVILESTVPPGTTENEFASVLKHSCRLNPQDPDQSFFIAYCPERAMPGSTMKEIVHNDRIIGSATKEGGEMARELYNSFCTGKIYITKPKVAEMVKLAENTYRDVNIAYAHTLMAICSELNIDCREVIGLANKHPRVDILNPSIGVGGHCLPVDPWFMIQRAFKDGRLIENARTINDTVPDWVVQKVIEKISTTSETDIGIFGMSYKKDSGDMRNSPSLKVFRLLKEKGYRVFCCEPNIEYGFSNGFMNVSPEWLLDFADFCIYAQDHTVFDDRLKREIKRRPHFDCTGALI